MYRRYKHNAKNPNERKEGSPGYDQEQAFEWLIGTLPNIHSYRWLSEHEKTKFDFVVYLQEIQKTFTGHKILIDVVSWTPQHTSIRLFTKHKDFRELMNYANEQNAKACYLAFCLDQTNIDDIRSWRFLRMHADLPQGDIYISKSRSHGLMRASFVFRDKRPIKTIMQEKCRAKYALRKKAEDELMQWIYSAPSVEA